LSRIEARFEETEPVTQSRSALERFFHDLATPLSAAGLHLERAIRQVDKGSDPSEALQVARHELERAFALFEKERAVLLSAPAEEPAP
jgi:signal transduction histidine kinase